MVYSVHERGRFCVDVVCVGGGLLCRFVWAVVCSVGESGPQCVVGWWRSMLGLCVVGGVFSWLG